jgi:hypothetical protein
MLNENSMPSDEERASKCLEYHARNVRALLGGTLDQMYSSMYMQMYRTEDNGQKEAYQDVVDCIEDIKYYAQKLISRIESAQKKLGRIVSSQQQPMAQGQQQMEPGV